MSTHKHQCGLITINEKGDTQLLDDFGCHRVFEHGDAPPGLPRTDPAFIHRHRCPNCGLGPWYAEYQPASRFKAAMALLALATLSGCSTVRPLTELSHISHATQHFGPNQTNYGWNIASVGVRWRPAEGVVVDLLEGYSMEPMNGRHEVFTGRITVEF